MNLHSAILAMAYRGLRVGALPGLTVRYQTENGKAAVRFTTKSKGKPWTGVLPAVVVRGLPGFFPAKPFANMSPGAIQAAFKRLTTRLAAEGKIAHAYSVHDLRHFFATTEYRKDRDLVRVSRLLNHGDVKVTTKYLHDLGEL